MSVLMLGRGERVVREEPAWYHGGYSRYGYPMFGKLILTNKRFIFVQQRVVEKGWFLAKKRELQTVGIKINLPIENVLGAITESRERKKGTLNEPPSLFSKEQYHVLIVSLDTPDGMENPSFEVADPQGWVKAIQRAVGGEIV